VMVSCRHDGGSNTHGSLDLEMIPCGLHVYVRMCEEERADAVKRRSQDSHCEVGGVHEPDRCVEYSAIERKSSGFVRTMFRDLRVDNRCGKRLSWCRSVFVMRSRELHVCLALVIRSWTPSSPQLQVSLSVLPSRFNRDKFFTQTRWRFVDANVVKQNLVCLHLWLLSLTLSRIGATTAAKLWETGRISRFEAKYVV